MEHTGLPNMMLVMVYMEAGMKFWKLKWKKHINEKAAIHCEAPGLR
jgi:hypothetical protein